MLFNQLEFCPQILKALEDQGYEAPSLIQEKAIPVVLSGSDILGCAQTGSGKTAAFALPILQILWNKYDSSTDHKRIRTLILTPTRELAVQIYDNFRDYGKYLPFSCGVIVGGVNQKQQETMLSRGVDILVATPGRLCDLIDQRVLSLNSVEIFVLDEADRMLDMGFISSVRKIAEKLKVDRQTLMFSATMPDEVVSLVDTLLKDYKRINAAPVSSTVETISQRVYFVDTAHKKDLLLDILADENIPQALVFTRTKRGADILARELLKDGVQAAAIHGNKTQNARQAALKSFKNGSVRILIATEIAARGIDIKELPYVFNYNIPEEAEMYIHRIGRTGRAGLAGIAISFCNYEERPLLKEAEKLIRKSIPVAENLKYPSVDTTIRKKVSRPGMQNSNAESPSENRFSHIAKPAGKRFSSYSSRSNNYADKKQHKFGSFEKKQNTKQY